jgi:hypothetical protein
VYIICIFTNSDSKNVSNNEFTVSLLSIGESILK